MNLLQFILQHDYCADVVCITETWGSGISDAELSIRGFNMYRSNRNDRGGGGVIIFVRADLASTVADVDLSSYDDIIGCSICLWGGKRLLVLCSYRADSNSPDQNSALFQIISDLSTSPYSHIILTGDFNYRQIDWNLYVWPALCDPFMNAISESGLFQHVERSTRLGSVLDLVFSNEEHIVSNVNVNAGISDHDSVTFDVICKSTNLSPAKAVRYKCTNWSNFRGELIKRLKHFPLMADSPIPKWVFLRDLLIELYHKYSVKVSNSELKNRPAYADAECWSAIKSRNNAYRSYQRHRSHTTWLNYQAKCAIAQKLCNRNVRRHEERIASSVNSAPKRFWSYAKSKMSVRPTITAISSPSGEKVCNPKLCADMFNSYFASVFTQENLHDPLPSCPDKTGESISHVTFTCRAVKERLSKAKKHATPGPDSISNFMMLQCGDALVPYLVIIFQHIFDTGIVPTDWKEAIVSPVHKKGPLDAPSNFRPISLTSCVSKLMEAVIRDHVVQFATNQKLLNYSQFGFVKGKSCVLQLLDFLDNVTHALNDGDCFDCVYMDFAKAFDKVPHRRLFLKLYAYGIRGNLLRFIEALLLDRTQRVVVHGHLSDSVPVTSGVPQGSVLGPTLFLFYIDDIDDCASCNVWKFADDTKLAQRIVREDPEAGRLVLQNSLDQAWKWVKLWESKFNVDKFVVLHFGRKNPGLDYFMNGTPLPASQRQKDLGVWLSNDLKPSFHIREVSATCYKILHIIRRSFSLNNQMVFLMLYKSLIRQRLEFASSSWSPYYVKDIDQIEKVQRFATRMIPSCHGMTYEERLCFLQLQTLKTRRLRSDLILLYQMCYGLVNFDLFELFERSPDLGLRGHSQKLRVRVTPKSDIRKYFYANRIVTVWNNLPRTVVAAPTISQFKSELHSSGALPAL